MGLLIAILGVGLLWVMHSSANELIVLPGVAEGAAIGKAIQNARDVPRGQLKGSQGDG